MRIEEYVEINGTKYLCGSAGSLILACSTCGEEHFRDPGSYMWTDEQREANRELQKRGVGKHEFDKCHRCQTRMEPIRLDEIETRWVPFWKSLGHETED